MLRLIHYQYLKNRPDPGRAKQVVKWAQNHITWGLQRPGETLMCSDAASTKYSQSTQFSFAPIILCRNSLKAWHLYNFPGIWALRNGTSVSPSPRQGGLGALCVSLALQKHPGQQTKREDQYFLQQQKAGWKIQLRLFSLWFNLTLC